MKNYHLKIPSSLFGGENSVEKIGDILKNEKIKNAIVFTDKGIKMSGLTDIILKEIEKVNVSYEIFDNLIPEPSYKDVENVMNDIKNYDGDIIIAIGGGSVMDVAKLCTVLKNAPYTIKDLLKDPSIAHKKIKSIMIPTTCGTGSEATCNAIVAIPEDETKVGIVNNDLIPDYVILDPRMIKSLPKSIIASTGVDALAHCVECLTSKKANPFSDLYSLNGGKLIFENIRLAYLYPNDRRAKENMLIGAFYGGIAITASGTTAVHALSYPLGGKFHIPHGISNAIIFAQVMEFNKNACLEQFSRLCDLINPSYANKSKEEKADYIISEIKDIVKVTEIPTNISKYGVQLSDIDFLVNSASQITRLLNNNLKVLSLDDIKNIYLKILS
ncbi:MAG: iron-containing alcohol dehydrogenase [Fusobacteriaceae bacterium]|nr:iron-containing alcohol dehydrogenase [Fusobacteriaceae bacterium]